MAIPVTVYHRHDNAHCSQVFTGLTRLNRQGLITLRQRSWRQSRLSGFLESIPSLILAELAGLTICFDLRDQSDVEPGLLHEVDCYFKRGYDPKLRGLHEGRKVRPLGLNFEVYDDGFDGPALERLVQGTGRLPSLPRRLGLDLKFHPRLKFFDVQRSTNHEPRVLFFTRLWHPSRRDPAASRSERDSINVMRIACVRALKAELGRSFVGGIEPSDLARQQAPDLVCGSGVAAKRGYLELMTRIPICVTTAGLHGSNGWKLGEYVATGRAILTEPLVHQVPGNLIAGKNYLTFTSPAECVEKAVLLMRNRPLRDGMMLLNREYFRRFLLPETVVLNALSLADAESAECVSDLRETQLSYGSVKAREPRLISR